MVVLFFLPRPTHPLIISLIEPETNLNNKIGVDMYNEELFCLGLNIFYIEPEVSLRSADDWPKSKQAPTFEARLLLSSSVADISARSMATITIFMNHSVSSTLLY